MTGTTDADVKASQASNFDGLSGKVADTPFDRHLRFLNYGYRPLDGEEPVGPRLGAAFPNRDSAQLLFQVVGDAELAGADVVEVGCGRGGNLWLLRRHHQPASVVGIDLSSQSIAFCHRSMPDDATFVVADAEQVPLGTAVADAVVSVETACTYPDVERYFREVARILRPGGRLLYTDLIPVDLVGAYVELLGALGFALDHQRDITANVAAARADRAVRQGLAFGEAGGDAGALGEFVGLDGSANHDTLTSGSHQYALARYTKVADVSPPAQRLLSDEHRALVRAEAVIAAERLTIPSVSAPPTAPA